MDEAINNIHGSGARYIVFTVSACGGRSYVADRVGRGISEIYEDAEAHDLALWLNQRDTGYPALARFEGGANWPEAGHG